MVIFHSYVSLPEGISLYIQILRETKFWHPHDVAMPGDRIPTSGGEVTMLRTQDRSPHRWFFHSRTSKKTAIFGEFLGLPSGYVKIAIENDHI